MTKICSKCGAEKKLSEFIKRAHNKSGVGVWCKQCARIHANEKHAENRERNNLKSKEWRVKNPEKAKESTILWRKNNHEKIKQYGRVYATENQEKIKAHRDATKDKRAIRAKVYRQENKDRARITREAWIKANPEKKREILRRWRAANPEKDRAAIQRAHRKRACIPKNRVSDNISKEIRASLRKGEKAGRHWEELVNFTIDQLKAHLEKRFKSGMTWENYGTYWHIDHKNPIAAFNFERPDDIDFRLCWSLKNLQPLEALKNKSKGAKIDKPFQPSLAMVVNQS